MAKKTNIASIDDATTVWQVNWCQVTWPEGEKDDLCTRDGERLFPLTYLTDATGSGPKVRMTEESALQLARVHTKEEFLANHDSGKHTFPAIVKIVRA